MTEHMIETSVDKSAWPVGPWLNEPDRDEWRYRSLPCLIVRNSYSGALCGYVGLPVGHPWRALGVGSDRIRLADQVYDYDRVPATVHGGLTYMAACHGDICHRPTAGESDDIVWIGFDCAHAFDRSPGMEAHLQANTNCPRPLLEVETYRDLAYVRNEVQQLADQALDAVV